MLAVTAVLKILILSKAGWTQLEGVVAAVIVRVGSGMTPSWMDRSDPCLTQILQHPDEAFQPYEHIMPET